MIDPSDASDEDFEYYSIPAYKAGAPTVVKGSEILSHKQLIPSNCVLFGKLNPRVQKVWSVASASKHRRLASTEWIVLNPTSEVDQAFLYFVLWSDWVMPIAQGLVSGSTPSRERVEPSAFYQIEVPLPPLDEQQRIAAALGTVKHALHTEDGFLTSTRDLKQAAMQQLFTRGLRGEGAADGYPETWRPARFDELATLHRGYDLPLSERTDGTVPVVGSNGVVGYHSEPKCLGPGVIIGRSGTIGKSFYVAGPYWPLNTGLFVSDFKGNHPLFVHYFMEWFDLRSFVAGVSVPTLNRNLVHEAAIRIPPLVDQEEIAAMLARIDGTIQVHERKRAALDQLFQTLLHDLMTGRLRVRDAGEGVAA